MAAESMYTSGQITAGSFFGGPLAGAAMMRANFLAMSDVGRAWKALLFGAAITVAALAAAALAPDGLPKSAIPVTYSVLFQQSALRFGMKKDVLVRNGAHIRSNWRVAGMSIAWFVITIAALAVVLFAFFFARKVATQA